MLTLQDIENTLIYLSRTDIKGSEAETMAHLKSKLRILVDHMANAKQEEEPKGSPEG